MVLHPSAVERRRRFNINDRIKELGTLLPKQQDQCVIESVTKVERNDRSFRLHKTSTFRYTSFVIANCISKLLQVLRHRARCSAKQGIHTQGLGRLHPQAQGGTAKEEDPRGEDESTGGHKQEAAAQNSGT